MSRRVVLAVTFLLAAGAAGHAGDPVAVREGTMAVLFTEYEPKWKTRPGANSANFADRKAPHTIRYVDLKTVELENQYLRLVVLPGAGGPVARALYKPRGWDLFHLSDRASNDIVSWTCGVKVSFPYKEHGIRLPDQPAAWRVVRDEQTGAATVATWMEFSRFDAPWNAKMFGRFSNMMLEQYVTLRPADASFRVTYRMVNPAPYRQGRQLWNDALFPRHHTKAGVIHDRENARGPTRTEWIFPAAHVSGHCGKDFRPWDAEAEHMAKNPRGASIFGWAIRHPFVGLWYPEVGVNRLRIADPGAAPGAKQFFTGEAKPSAAVELWTGTDSIFEEVENWIGPGEAFEWSARYVLVEGIGKVDYANDRAALRAAFDADEPRIELVTYRPRDAVRVELDGKPLGPAQPCGPERPARFSLPEGRDGGRVRVVAGDEMLVDVRLPLEIGPDEERYERIRRALDPSRPESQEKMGDSASMGRQYRGALGGYAKDSTGRGRVLYRAGSLDAAAAALLGAVRRDPEDGEAWHLLGATLLEQGLRQAAGAAFENALASGRPYPPARYFLALRGLGERHGTPQAIEHLRALVEARPQHREARLLLAWLEAVEQGGDEAALERAEVLATEWPARPAAVPRKGPSASTRTESPRPMGAAADPRAQYVLWKALAKAGRPERAGEAKAAYEALAAEPGTARRMEEFLAATRGEYRPPRRMLDFAQWRAREAEESGHQRPGGGPS